MSENQYTGTVRTSDARQVELYKQTVKELQDDLRSLLARIAELEAEKESWGNEFNAVIIMKERVDELEAERELIGRLVAEGNKLIEKMTAENAELRARLETAMEALEIAYQKLKTLPWTGGASGPRWLTAVREALSARPAPSKRVELLGAVIRTALHFRRSHKQNEELALHEFNVMIDAIDALDAEEGK